MTQTTSTCLFHQLLISRCIHNIRTFPWAHLSSPPELVASFIGHALLTMSSANMGKGAYSNNLVPIRFCCCDSRLGQSSVQIL
ncbi:hypothetical protein CEXT_810591 [Caerostris extrusa]|uniref:Uncharacterized protein n=1 Tax=Caerostris extrusa TaxID=172846 RepID=A0AAV4QI28_CAEEX|nr:hypothetical protein CEXT_810591 [Caerostris extrusa]